MKNARREFLRQVSALGVAGAAAPLALQLAAAGEAAAQSATRSSAQSATQSATQGDGGYKALVCVFLYGGNDSYNTVVPYDGDAYGKYSRIRTDIALARAQGFALNPGRIVTNSWGIGVAVRYPDGRIAGALSIAAIESRMQPPRQEELAALLRQEARQVEARIASMLDRRQGKPAQDEIRTAETTP